MTPTSELESELLPSDRQFDRMKAELLERLDESATVPEAVPDHLVPPRRRRTRRMRRSVGIGILVAAVVAATLVVTNVVGPHSATAEAAEVLHTAALASIQSSDPVVAPGQYLKIETTGAGLEFTDNAAYVDSQRIILYVPADRSDDWVLSRQQLPPGKQYGDASAQIREDFSGRRADGSKPGDVVLHRAAGGKFIGFSLPFAELKALPKEPDALYTYLYSHVTGDQSKDQEVFGEINQLLIDGLVPAKLRGAMYDVLARIPGVYLANGKANLDGRTGVGISLLDSTGLYVQQVIIDPASGLLIGTRELDVKATGTVPAGVSQDWSAVTTTVVDGAPTGPFTKELQPG